MKKYYDLFRQDRETIKERVFPFLEYFRGLGPIADLGCGRGEFSELLANENFEYTGIDSDPDMIGLCREMGLLVRCESLFEFLKEAKDYGGLFISHVIEHLASDDAEKMLDLCRGSLKKGGRVVLITPNPENISVMTKAFWLDSTHIRPYPLVLMEEMLKERGFRIISSGGAPGTFGNIKLQSIRGVIARIILPIVGLAPYWNYLYAAQDVYVAAEKI